MEPTMAKNIGQLDSRLQQLESEFDATWNYDKLFDMEMAAHDVERAHGVTARSSALIGAILKRRMDWEAASLHLLSRAADFPEHLDLLYEAALTAIDAGTYRRGQQALLQLMPELGRLTERQLRGLWRAAPLLGLHEVAISAFRLACERGNPHCTPEIERRLVTAQANAANQSLRRTGIISLGENCLPWHLGQRWGLRAHDTMFVQESPFNLAQTVTDGVSGLLEDGIDQLIEPARLSLSGMEHGGTPRPLNNHYRFDFNHERGGLFTDDKFAGLVTRYSERIKNLRRYLYSEPCLFLHYTEREGDLNHLAHAVAAACAHPHWRLVIFDVWEGERPRVKQDRRVRYNRRAMPFADYRWFQPDHWDHDNGLAFERELQGIVLHTASELASELTC